MVLASVGACLGGLITVEIAVSAVIYVVFVNYVVQHFSNESYFQAKRPVQSTSEKVWDSITYIYSAVTQNYMLTFSVLILKGLIILALKERRKVYQFYQRAKQGCLIIYYLMKESQQLKTNLEEQKASLERSEASLREVIDSAKFTQCRGRTVFLSARPLSEGTPRRGIMRKSENNLLQEKLMEVELKNHFYQVAASKTREMIAASDTVNTDASTLSSFRKNCPTKIRKPEQPWSASSSRLETTSPFNRPLVTAETTSVLSSHRFSPEYIPKLENFSSNSQMEESTTCSAKISETFRKRNEIRKQIDVCLHQLDESLISQCDSIATQPSSFITSPKQYGTYNLSHSARLAKFSELHRESFPTDDLIEDGESQENYDENEDDAIFEQTEDYGSVSQTYEDTEDSEDERNAVDERPTTSTYRLEADGKPACAALPERLNGQQELLRSSALQMSREVDRSSDQKVFGCHRGDTLAGNVLNAESSVEDQEGSSLHLVNRQFMNRISTPFHNKRSTTSSTDLDNYCGASSHGDDAFDAILNNSVDKKPTMNTFICGSSSGDHSLTSGEQSSLISKSQFFASSDPINVLSGTGQIPLFTSTVETESEFFKTDSTFNSQDDWMPFSGTVRLRAPTIEEIESKDFNDSRGANSQITSVSWSTEPDSAAIQLLDVPKLETCIMDRSLCLQIEFATLSFQSNSVDNRSRKQVSLTECVQNIQTEMKQPAPSVKEEKCHFLQLNLIRQQQQAKMKEHESNRSFELLSFRSDIYIEFPSVKEEIHVGQRKGVRSPFYSSSESRNFSSPVETNGRSKLPVSATRYPSTSSSWSNKGMSPRYAQQVEKQNKSTLREPMKSKQKVPSSKKKTLVEMASYSFDEAYPAKKGIDFSKPDPRRPSSNERTSSSTSRKLKIREESGRESRDLKLTSTLKQYSKQNVFNRLYK